MESRERPPNASAVIPHAALLSGGLLETSGPVRHDTELEFGADARLFSDRDELLSSSGDVVIPGLVHPALARGETRREKRLRRPRGGLWIGTELRGEKPVSIPEENLPAAPPPDRLDPPVLGDLQLRAGLRKGADVDLVAPRLVGHVGHPQPVG